MIESDGSANGITLKGMSEIMAIGHTTVSYRQDLGSLKIGVLGFFYFSDEIKDRIFAVKKYRGENEELLVEYKMKQREIQKPDSITPFFLLLLTVSNIVFYNHVTIVPPIVRGGLILILLGMTYRGFMNLFSGERERELKEKIEMEIQKLRDSSGRCETFYYSI